MHRRQRWLLRTSVVLCGLLVATALIGLGALAARQHHRIRALEAQLAAIEGAAVASAEAPAREIKGLRAYIRPAGASIPVRVSFEPTEPWPGVIGLPGPNYDQWDLEQGNFDRSDQRLFKPQPDK